ncbi:helix-turn-helix domain-containing protein [Natronomonas gomsonensis]|uniref:winged helix-turn-helix transcriptional regulator n=1 Tax=Natronomonas gomsonensis TaxID=1046043 RepID=UPI0020CA2CF7|nr:helix-turn-helix domain-containing protein [Natronomonas gomsonensis]MCY4729777.1 helix-turn-helix domain-containing protein [Natronomonas gomsonensis]
MSNTHMRRLLAVLAALLVVCSAVGAPVAAASTSTFEDGLNGTFGSGDSEDGDSTSDDTNDDTNDGEADTDGDTSDDTDGDSGDSTSDSTDDDASDDSDGASSSDESTADTTDGSTDDTTSGDREGDNNSSTGVRNRVNDTAGGINDTVENATDEAGDTAEDSTDDIDWRTEVLDYIGDLENAESLDEHRFEGLYVETRSGSELAVETLEAGTGIESDETVETTATTTTATLTTVGGTLTSGSDEVLVGAVGTSAASDSDNEFDEIVLDDGDDAPAGAAMSAGGAGGTGGQPLPTAPAGGAAVGLGAVAAVAAFRGSAFLSGSAGVGASAMGAFAAMPRFTLTSLVEKLRPFFFPLRYSRYDDSDPLEHEARERVYEIVNEAPGSYLSEVSEEADLPLSTTRHHVRVLEREDLVSGAKLRGKRRFYPAYAEGIELAAALNDDSTASIIDAIARLGSASVSDLAGELGRDPSTITHHLQRLEEDGIITREREGRAVMNKLSAEARTALEPETVPKPGEPGGAIAGGAD